jgi:hypothetical protein
MKSELYVRIAFTGWHFKCFPLDWVTMQSDQFVGTGDFRILENAIIYTYTI